MEGEPFNPSTTHPEQLDIEEDASDIEKEDTPWEDFDYNDIDDDAEAAPEWQEKPIEWSKTPTRNVIKTKAGPTPYSKDANEPIKSFKLFFNQDLLHVLYRYCCDKCSRNLD